MAIRVKTITSGNLIEKEIYNISIFEKSKTRKKKKKETRAEQKRLNAKNTRKYVERIINTNFKNGVDYYVTLSYSNTHLPGTEKRLLQDRKNFLQSLRLYAKKNKLGEIKCLAVTEYRENSKGKQLRMHHHMILSGNIPREIIENKWKKGRKKVLVLEEDEKGFKDLATYLMKDPQGKTRYYRSRNLDEPDVSVNDYKFSRRKTYEIAREDGNKEYYEKLFPGLDFKNSEIKVNEVTDNIYIYLRFRRKDE